MSSGETVALAFGDFVFDPERQVLRKHGVTLKVDPQQLALLACLVARPGKVLTREELLEQAWEGRVVTGGVVSVAVAKLRKVLGGDREADKNTYIENRYGRGYRFAMPVVEVAALPEPLPTDLPISESRTPLMGREQLCEQLTRVLSAACAGQGSLCALIGEAGIGKTRLAETLQESAGALGVRCAWARYAAAEGAPPLFAFTRALRELNLEGLADEVLASLDTLGEQQAAAAQPVAAGQLSQELMLDARANMHRLLDQIAQSLLSVGRLSPLLIVLDDVHWADAASLRLLSYLLNDLSRMRVLIVVTLRGTGSLDRTDPRHAELLRLLSHRRCERHELARLSETDVAEYVAAHFGCDAPELSRAVYARSGGNPFYMVELLRPFSGSETPSAEQLRFPGVALDLMRRRLMDLPESSRAALSVASVIGHDFDLGLLSRVTARGAEYLLEALDSSLANESIVASAQAPGAFAFAHELIREVLYSELPASERCRLHLAVGQALEARRAAGIQIASTELAHHFLSALPHGDVRDAIGHARAAAAAAMRMAAHVDARQLLTRALEAVKFGLEAEPATLTALLLELALCERVLGTPGYGEHLRRGVSLARQHRLGEMLATAGQLLSPGPGLLQRADAHDVLSAALEALPEDDARNRAMVLVHLSWTPPNCMSATRVQSLLSQAEAQLALTQSPDAHAKLRDARLFFQAGPATQAQAEITAQEIEEDLRARPEVARSARVLAIGTARMLMALQRGDVHAAHQSLEGRNEMLTRLHNVELEWHQARMLLVLRMNRGDFSGMAHELEQLRQRSERLGLQAGRALWARDYGQLLYWTGDPKVLAPHLKSVLTLSANDNPLARSYKLRVLVEMELLTEAREALSQISCEALRDLPQDRDYLGVLAQYSMAVYALGSKPHAEVLYELLAPYPTYFGASISFECVGSLSHFLGQLACVRSDRAAAFDHFQHAVIYNERAELHACAVQSQYELARLLVAEGPQRDLARARALLAEAHEQAIAMGLNPLVRLITAAQQATI